jgi:hypothetical protein
MVGVGAIAGTISGGNTNAARSPDIVPATPIVASAIEAPAFNTSSPGNPAQPNTAQSDVTNTTTVVMTMRRPAPEAASTELAATAVIASRFPTHWQQQPAPRIATGDNDPPTRALSYAADTPRDEPARPAEAPASSYQLASVDPVPVPMPRRMTRPAEPKPAVLFNDAQLASIKARLKLSRDQEQYWPPVEQALRAISWKLATQQSAKRIVRGSQASMIDPNSAEVARLKSAAFPLIMSMREDQKREVRQLAHTMGLKQVASMF